jgi:hypothetical protein
MEDRRWTRARPDERGEGLETEIVGLLLKRGAGLTGGLTGVVGSGSKVTGDDSSGKGDGLESFGGGVGGFGIDSGVARMG